MACRLISAESFLNKCRLMIWHILISESVSVYGRYVVGLISVCCRLRFQHCANDRFSIGVILVIYRSEIGRFHTESYPKWTQHEPGWFYGVFSIIVGGRQLADSLKMFCFCRFRVDLAGVTGELGNWLGTHFHGSLTDSNPGSIRLTNLYMATRRYFSRYILGGVISGVLCYITRYSYVPHLLCNYS